MAALGPLLGHSWAALGRSWVTLGPLWGALGLLLRVSWPLLGRSWPPKLAQIGLQDAFGNDFGSKTRIYKKYWKTQGKTHIFDPKMAPKCPKMAPRWFQDRSWSLLDRSWAFFGRSWGVGKRSGGPLRAILERSCPSWRELGVSGGDLGASWGDLGAILGAQEGMAQVRGGGRCPQGWAPLETFYESFCF